MQNLWKNENPENVIDEDYSFKLSSFKLSSLKTLQLKINCSCPGLQRHHVNCTPKLSPASFPVNGNSITQSSNLGSLTKNIDTGLESASWTQQQFISISGLVPYYHWWHREDISSSILLNWNACTGHSLMQKHAKNKIQYLIIKSVSGTNQKKLLISKLLFSLVFLPVNVSRVCHCARSQLLLSWQPCAPRHPFLT